MSEPTDSYLIGRLIGRARLLIAISEEIPTETKLQTQGVLKMLEREVSLPEHEQDSRQIRACHAMLCDELEAYPDLEALLSAMRTFIAAP